MHVSEGVLSAPVLATGGGLAVAGVAYALKKMDYDRIPQVAVMSSAFFVASLIHVPSGPGSVHLVLNGLTGLVLGWAAFPAILVALFLQAVIFQFGGLTTLGVNTLNMALPAVVCFLLLSRPVRSEKAVISRISAFACGALAIAMSGIMLAFSLIWSEERFLEVAKTALIFHLPVMLIEGVVTAFIVDFLRKVKPEILEAPYAGSKIRGE